MEHHPEPENEAADVATDYCAGVCRPCLELIAAKDGNRLTRSSDVVFVKLEAIPTMGFVSRFAHKRVDLRWISDLQFKKPAIPKRIGVDQGRIVHDPLVGLDDLTADRRANIGGRLD